MIAQRHLISYVDAFQQLALLNQEHLLRFWPQLSSEQQRHLLRQIERIDGAKLTLQRRLLSDESHLKSKLTNQNLLPFNDFNFTENREDASLGCELIAQGKVGCIIIAGGQGTRLKSNAPKGTFPVTPIKHKSLFQLFVERALYAGKRAKRPLLLAMMTSPQNHDETVAFFEKNHRFGMEASQLYFFSQGESPLLDEEGNLFLNKPGSITFGPDGNGDCLAHFVNSGLWKVWKDAGIQYVSLILVDNALADPFHAEFIGYHSRLGSQVTVKCIERLEPEEKLGLLIKTSQGIRVIEYSEMPESERIARLPDGKLKHRSANISTFCFDIDFIAEAPKIELPWHLAHKAMPYVDMQGKVFAPSSLNSWKFERYIFDLLPWAKTVSVMLCPRDQCFAPLKNDVGADSLQTVQKALLQRDKQILEKITGRKVKKSHMELSQEFYYPTPELMSRWSHHQMFDEGYIDCTDAEGE